MTRRECTTNYKLDPLRHAAKRLLGRDPTKAIHLPPDAKPLARQWIGISSDEWIRAKVSRVRWLETRHPFLEDHHRMTRGHCLEWLAAHDYPEPPRSACTFCPYHSDHEWRNLKKNPDDWDQAVRIDRLIRDFPLRKVAGFKAGGQLFVHRSGQALEDVDLTDPHQVVIPDH